jgi:hypothetical protein
MRPAGRKHRADPAYADSPRLAGARLQMRHIDPLLENAVAEDGRHDEDDRQDERGKSQSRAPVVTREIIG